MKREINIGLIGSRFMGKAHSNAYRRVGEFFELPVTPVLHTICGRNEQDLKKTADSFGWKNMSTSWQHVVEDPDIEVIDICTPNYLHMPVAIAAANAGKKIICEKPIARNAQEAQDMVYAVAVADVVNMMIFNYRYVPAIRLIKSLIDEGKIGAIFHFNAVYYQDWLVDPHSPFVWRHNIEESGSGAHGDMNAHVVDLARFLIGEFESVCGLQKTFITHRPQPGKKEPAVVSTDDTCCFQAKFRNGALGSFVATRLAAGRKNFLRLEIFGSKGSVNFNLERLNEVEFFLHSNDKENGFRNILVTEQVHPYISNWWPPGHVIGWEHAFVHQFSDFFNSIGGRDANFPDFNDGLNCQFVLDAIQKSSDTNKWTALQNKTSFV
ncbi:MAG: Gfo/Idh/MocA family oxidoreductase [Chitinophagaceae bacterium]|nr:Gfo/Idh/MocA family oxidoreductase [Chitinophagaceae bacterium]